METEQAVAAAGSASGNRKGLGIAVFIFGGSLGFAAGPLAIIAAVHFWGLAHSYHIIVPGLISVIVLIRYLQIPRKKVGRSRLGSLQTTFQDAFRPMTALFGVAVLREFTRLAVVTFLPLFFTMRGWSLLESGTTLTLFSLAGLELCCRRLCAGTGAVTNWYSLESGHGSWLGCGRRVVDCL